MDTLQILIIVLAVVALVAVVWLVAARRRSAPAPTLDDTPATAPPRPRPPELSGRLAKTTHSLSGALRGVFGRSALDGEFWEGLEEALIGADVGVGAATDVVARVRSARPADVAAARDGLERELVAEFDGRERTLDLGDAKPAIVLIVGVNGAGKTTSIAKLAARLQKEGLVPLLGAADTFRAGAGAQLQMWGDRVGADVVGGQEGADPASVAFDSYQAARSRGCDVVIVDTAGRLQSKQNLMAELGKVRRVLERQAGPVAEVLLVLDATAGQNGIAQVEEFAREVGVTGIILTKLDGTARGGVVVAVERSLGIPVKFIGLGEKVEDMVEFEPSRFVAALLAEAPAAHG